MQNAHGERRDQELLDQEGKVFRNYYKGHMDKTKGEGGSKGGREVGGGGIGGGEIGGEKMQTIVIKQQ